MKKLLIIALVGITAVSCSKEGCTDPTAYNYNADATSDDGSCTFEGCTDPNAVNYDANATMSSTCIYDQVGIWTSTAQEISVSGTVSMGGIPLLDTSYSEVTHPDSLNPTGIDILAGGVLVSHYSDEPSDTGSWSRSNDNLTLTMLDTSLVFLIDSVESNFMRLTNTYSETQTDNSQGVPLEISISMDTKFEFSR